MSETPRLTTSREHFRVTTPDDAWEVWTRPFDYSLQARTAKQHSWLTREEDPFGYLLFITWAASRHSGDIEMTVKFEAYRELVDDIEKLEPEKVGPTEPDPGAGS
jgi:hypothetical protein